MRNRILGTAAVTLAVSLTSLAATSAPKAELTADEARTIGMEAYVYFYPLITMDVTRRQLTNTTQAQGISAPMNTFANIGAYPTADMRAVVRPNFDTLYSSAWLDLTKAPVVVSVPDTDGRYYLLPMLDMWTDVFASPGWRTTGTEAGSFLLTPPGWSGKVPDGVKQIQAPTPYVWIIGRTKTDGPADYDAVHKIQAGLKIQLLGADGKLSAPSAAAVDPSVDMKTPPKEQVRTMPADKYFAYAAELMKVHPPHLTDQAQVARLKRIGIEPGKSFDLSKADPVVQKALTGVPEAALELMRWKTSSLARVVNGWQMNTDTMGVYGNFYLKRAIVADLGLGANQPEDAIYPMNLADESGHPLDGANRYVVHFEKGNLPPVEAFWSITLYDNDGFQVANSLNRFAVSSWMKFLFNADGSLDLYVQNASPGADKEANWLPAPKGPFNLTMRLYAPKSDALTGKWNPPPVMRAASRATPLAQ